MRDQRMSKRLTHSWSHHNVVLEKLVKCVETFIAYNASTFETI